MTGNIPRFTFQVIAKYGNNLKAEKTFHVYYAIT